MRYPKYFCGGYEVLAFGVYFILRAHFIVEEHILTA